LTCIPSSVAQDIKGNDHANIANLDVVGVSADVLGKVRSRRLPFAFGGVLDADLELQRVKTSGGRLTEGRNGRLNGDKGAEKGSMTGREHQNIR
jgi:hypothetical protein